MGECAAHTPHHRIIPYRYQSKTKLTLFLKLSLINFEIYDRRYVYVSVKGDIIWKVVKFLLLLTVSVLLHLAKKCTEKTSEEGSMSEMQDLCREEHNRQIIIK